MPNRIHACAETNQRYSLYFHFQLTLVFRRKLDSLLHIIKLHKMNKHEKKTLSTPWGIGSGREACDDGAEHHDGAPNASWSTKGFFP